ncbi:MAG: hypothetical protein ACPG7F_04395 [Aggregatilineales bacterium]
MSTQIGWLIENKVVYVKISGILTRTMLESNANFLVKLLDATSSDTHIHAIIDSLAVEKYDVPTTALNEISKAFLQHPRLLSTTDVTHSTSTQTTGRIVNMFARNRWKSFRIMPQALSYLNKTYPGLESLDESVLASFKPLMIHK